MGFYSLLGASALGTRLLCSKFYLLCYAALLKFLPIMLKLCSNYAQALYLISHVLLINLQLWAHNKWLKHIITCQNARDRKDRDTLIEQSAA